LAILIFLNKKNFSFCFRESPFLFFEILFLRLHPSFFRARNSAKHPESTPPTPRNSDQGANENKNAENLCDDQTSIWKNVFFGVKRDTIDTLNMTWKQQAAFVPDLQQSCMSPQGNHVVRLKPCEYAALIKHPCSAS